MPATTILVTSRERLGVAGEKPVLVQPLPLSSDAEQLFRDRAQLDADPADVTEMCAGLDGMPLAIELAAARAATLPLAEIADRLDDRFALLESASRAADPRHRADRRRPRQGIRARSARSQTRACRCGPPPRP